MKQITEIQKEKIVNAFLKDQTLKNLGTIKKAGIQFMQIKNSSWEHLNVFTLPKRFIKLYDDDFKIMGIGSY